MEYGAIDLHTKHSQIRIVTADGAVVFERRIVTRADQFAAVFGGRARMRILLESVQKASGSPRAWKRSGTRRSLPIPIMRRCTGCGPAGSKRIGVTSRRWRKPTAPGSIGRRIASVGPSVPSGSGCWYGASSCACAPR